MENVTTQNLAITDESWNADREDALNCQSYDLQSLVDRVISRWKSASITYKAMAYGPSDRARVLSLAKSLRAAEQAIFAVLKATFPAMKDGYSFPELMAALFDCRVLISLPTAKRMAEQDEAGRSEKELAVLLVQKAQFVDGRVVISQSLASELPSPYKSEAAHT